MFILLQGRVDNMQILQLTLFQIRKQITSLSFIAITAIFVIFAVTQMGEIFHYPVKNNADIVSLKERGGDVKEYLYIKASPEELKINTIDYLNKIISQNQMEEEDANVFKNLIYRMDNENLSFDKAYKIIAKENPELLPWLDACRNQFQQKLGNVDEINNNIKLILDEKGYNIIVSQKYVTYIQLISAFLILPLFLILFTNDSRSNINEIIYVHPIESTRYILCKYFSCLIPILLILYILGETMNFYVAYKFKTYGWQADYSGFSSYYMTFIVPTILFLSSLIMFLLLLLKKAIAVFPLYILYVIFNATQGAFSGHSTSNAIYKCIIRLTSEDPYNNFTPLNRALYLVLSVFLIGFSCMLYKNSRKNSRRSITL